MTPHKRFIELRDRLGLSQEAACKRCKVSLRSLRYFESGKRKRVTLGYLYKLVDGLGCSVKVEFTKDPVFAETERIENKGW